MYIKLINLTLGLVTAGLLWSCKPEYQTADTPKQSVTQVYIQELTAQTQPIPIHATGLVGSESEMQLSFKIGGIIQAIYVDAGDQVRKGQVLATLRPDEIQAQVSKAEQARDMAKRDLERAQNLYQDTVITLEQYQNTRTAFEVAEADLKIANFNQQYARILAPSDGTILRKFAEPNELVNPGTPLMMLGGAANRSAYTVKVGIADKDIIKLQGGDSATVRFDAYPQEVFTAVISRIPSAADPQTGVFEVELTLTPTSLPIKNGFVGEVNIFPTQQQPYYKISMNALVEGNSKEAKVFVPSQDSQHAKAVTIVPEYIGDDFFTVSQAKWPGNKQVITDGAAYLREGDTFSIATHNRDATPTLSASKP